MLTHSLLLDHLPTKMFHLLENYFCPVKHLYCQPYHTINTYQFPKRGAAMPEGLLEILIAWLIALAIFFGFIVFLRALQHREHMAMISSGMHPNSFQRQ